MPTRKSTGKSRGSKETLKAPRALNATYRLLFENNPQPMWVYDVETLVFLAVNLAAVEQYGYSHNEFLRMTIRDIRPAQDIPALLDIVDQQVEGLLTSSKCKHQNKDGSLIDVEITSHDLDWSGRSARLVLATDITERTRTEERLIRSEESYRKLVEESPDAMLVHRHGAIIFANSACARLFGAFSANELLGRQHLDSVHPNDREVVKQRIQEFADDLESVRRYETQFLRLDGKEIYAEVVARSVVYNGEPSIQVMLRDISERLQAEKMLRRREADLAAAQRIAHLGSYEMDISNLDGLEKIRYAGRTKTFASLGMSPDKSRFPGQPSWALYIRRIRSEYEKSLREAFVKETR